MYDELVEDLRRMANTWLAEEYKVCAEAVRFQVREAADAIEELSKDRDNWKATAKEEREGYWHWFDNYQRDVPRWIPVTEQPPLKVGDDGYNGYLVYANGYYEIADYTTDKFDNVPYFHVNGEYETDVTHWMPLPEPPKEDTK